MTTLMPPNEGNGDTTISINEIHPTQPTIINPIEIYADGHNAPENKSPEEIDWEQPQTIRYDGPSDVLMILMPVPRGTSFSYDPKYNRDIQQLASHGHIFSK